MPPRALWTGTISFGLVNVPVRMYSATREHDLHFNFVHEKDGSRIGYEKICKKEGVPVPDDEIVKAYEWDKGEWVYLTDEDFEAASADGTRTIDISDFVDSDDIDPIYFEKTYYLGPQEGGEKVYALLAKALDQSGLAGIAKFVMRDRQHLGALRVRDGVIALERMYFADEVVEPKDVKPPASRVEKRELDMAIELIDRFRGEWKPEQYKDTYRDALMDVIKRKRKGEKIHAETTPEPEETADLMEALRASLAAAKGTSAPKKRAASTRKRAPARKSRAKASRK
jgi:DNA end-binding protein Ku